MKEISHTDNRTVFEPTVPAGPWKLIVFDDYWYEAHNYFSSARDPMSQEAQDKWFDDMHARAAMNQGPVGLLPVYCANLPELRQLILMDFPPCEGDIHRVLEEEAVQADSAFLIDIGCPANSRIGDELVVPALQSYGISMSRCAFLSEGYRHAHDLVSMKKPDVRDKKGAPILEWWNRVLGSIDVAYFQVNTGSAGIWPHDPSEVPRVLEGATRESFLENFVSELARRDTYGVWKWVKGVLSSDCSAIKKQYAYLCGKAFLHCPEEQEFFFTALRGLFMGVAHVLPETTRNVEVIEQPPDIPAVFARDINNVDCLSCCRTGRSTFEEFAESLRKWLVSLETNKSTRRERHASLKRIALHRGNDKHQIELSFTEALPEAIFQESEIGGVRRGWTRLRGCFTGDLEPEVDAKNGIIRLYFRRVGPDGA